MILTEGRIKAILFLITFFSANTFSFGTLSAQDADVVLNYRSGLYGSTADQLPFWLHSNKLGKVDSKSTNFINELGFQTLLAELQNFSLKAGVNAVSRLSEDESIHFDELYVSAALHAFQLDAGRFAQPIGVNNHELSVGSMMVSRNATPLTKISLSNPDFVNIPLTDGIFQYKGLFSHGSFSGERYVQDPYLHQKYLYLRLNIENFSGTGGFIHNAVWAGSRGSDKLPQSFEDYFRVVTGLGSPDSSDAPGIEIDNVLGNSVAAYEFEALYRFENFNLSVTRLFYLEDKVSTRFRSPWDGVWGINFITVGEGSPVNAVTYEHINTKTQDAKSFELIGRRDYYDNGLYKSGWTHEHRVLGIPLILYDEELDTIVNNVLIGHHLGFTGYLTNRISYRTLLTYSRNYGIQDDWVSEGGDSIPKDRDDIIPREQFRQDQYSFLIDFQYVPSGGEGLGITLSIGSDMGELYEDNLGIMLGLSWNKFLSY